MLQKSESITKLAGALAKAQAELKPAPMNATNPFLKNRYADLGAVIESSKPVLARNGLSVAQPISGDGSAVTVNTILMHESGEWISSEVSLSLGEERGKSQAQVAGSVITYLRRYSLAAILGIYADEDTDGNDHKPQQQPPSKDRVAEPQKPQNEPPTYTGTSGESADSATNADSKGKPFAEMAVPELVGHLNEYEKRLKANGLSPDERALVVAKRDEARRVLEAKKAQ